jgi:NADH-quinone oxidoreductase subunit M
MLGAVLIRKGIVPFHSWMPDFFERVPMGVAILFAAPQIGAYATARFVVPYAPEAVLTVIGYSALFTAVYGACLALVQKDARRAFAFIFLSQSALVMAGLESTSLEGLTGGLCLWVSCGLSLAGFGMALWVLEARRGFLSLDRFHGGYDRMPLLASSFLLLGLGSIGFPGTLGFLGEELLIEGAVTQYPRVGFVTLLATAINGISILSMYLSLFCGAPDRTPRSQTLRKRELVGFAALVVMVVLGGLFPQDFVGSRRTSALEILHARKGIPAEAGK